MMTIVHLCFVRITPIGVPPRCFQIERRKRKWHFHYNPTSIPITTLSRTRPVLADTPSLAETTIGLAIMVATGFTHPKLPSMIIIVVSLQPTTANSAKKIAGKVIARLRAGFLFCKNYSVYIKRKHV